MASNRLPLVDPDARGFWSLAVEPPLPVLLAGLFFHRFIASGLIRDPDGNNIEAVFHDRKEAG